MATVTINSDKTININGIKTFPVYIYAMCHPTFTPGTSCNPAPNTDFILNTRIYTPGAPETSGEVTAYSPKFESYGIYWVADAHVASSIMTSADYSKPFFFGYIQVDEPDGTTAGETTNDLQTSYSNVKNFDPNHPVILNHYLDAEKWYFYCDIFTWDRYTIKSDTLYVRADAIYEYELRTAYQVFDKISIDSIPNPVWAVIQANGIPTTILAYVPTPKEARANTYSAICMNVKGIGYWSYYTDSGGAPTGYGLAANATLHDYYTQLAREIRLLNDILVSPTVAYLWHGHADTTNAVTVNPNPAKLVENISTKRFSYILKNKNGIPHLIVVNKDSTSISNVTITINGLTGTMTATTLGFESTGSQAAGRTLTVTNGTFVDSFDGYAAHVYQIACPNITINFTIS